MTKTKTAKKPATLLVTNNLPKKNKRGGNRKGEATLYKPEYVWQVECLKREGWPDQKIADFYNVNRQTIVAWKKKHAAFREAIENGREVAIHEVENALFHRAIGYMCLETRTYVIEKELVTKTVIVRHPPETKAALILLKNWAPDKWKDRHEIYALNSPNSGQNIGVTVVAAGEEQQRLLDDLRARKAVIDAENKAIEQGGQA
jgi:superfamily II RNA helicase